MCSSKITLLDLTRAGLPTVSWEQIVTKGQLETLKLPIILGVMDTATNVIVNNRTIDDKETLYGYYDRLLNAYGVDAEIIASQYVEVKESVTISIDGDDYKVDEGETVDVGADKLLSIIKTIQSVLKTGESSILKFKVEVSNSPIILEVL